MHACACRARKVEILDSTFDQNDLIPNANVTTDRDSLRSLIFFIHLAGCLMWLIKVLLEDESSLIEYLNRKKWLDDDREIDIHSVHGKLDAYVVTTYFVTVVVTTVGFGDIIPESSEERVACMILMIIGAFVWGTLLAQVGEIHRAATLADQEKLLRVSTALDFLNDNDVPRYLRQQIVDWERFYLEHGGAHKAQKEMINRLPDKLQRELVMHLYSNIIGKVPVLKLLGIVTRHRSVIPAERSPDWDLQHNHFLSDLFLRLSFETYEAGGTVVGYGRDADRMLMIVSGKVIVEYDVDVDSDVLESTELGVGDFLGDMAILGDTRWSASSLLRTTNAEVRARAAPFDFVVTLALTREDFDFCLSKQNVLVQSAVENCIAVYRHGVRELDLTARQSDERPSFARIYATIKWDTVVSRLLWRHKQNDNDSSGLDMSHFSKIVQTRAFRRKFSTKKHTLSSRSLRAESSSDGDDQDDAASAVLETSTVSLKVDGGEQQANERDVGGHGQNGSSDGGNTITLGRKGVQGDGGSTPAGTCSPEHIRSNGCIQEGAGRCDGEAVLSQTGHMKWTGDPLTSQEFVRDFTKAAADTEAMLVRKLDLLASSLHNTTRMTDARLQRLEAGIVTLTETQRQMVEMVHKLQVPNAL